ncbi:hypothetical protein D3C77_495580 [compost metagenome]
MNDCAPTTVVVPKKTRPDMSPRHKAGMIEPLTPKESRSSMAKGRPYFAAEYPFRAYPAATIAADSMTARNT